MRNSLKDKKLNDHSNLTIIEGDILDYEYLSKSMIDSEIIIHCAAIAGIDTVIKDPVLTMKVNMIGSANVLEAASYLKKLERLVCFSTSDVFGMLERQGRIFTAIVDNVTAEKLMNEIINHAEKGSVFYTDKFKSYKSLKFYGKHISIDHGKEFGKGRRHINGLEGFWSFAKERLLKYHGVSKSYFHLYLKEMEFRYNYRKENIYHKLIKIHFGPFSA
jgi:transposase